MRGRPKAAILTWSSESFFPMEELSTFARQVVPFVTSSGEVTEYVGISMDVTERKRAEDELRASEYRHRHIFQANYVSIWEEDWSLVKAAIDDLATQGIRDFRQYVEAHPEFVRQAVAMVRVLDVNEATVRLFGAERKQQLLSSLDRIFASQSEDIFAEELIAIAEGRTSFEAETVLRTLQGDDIAVLFTITFPHPSTLETVLVSIIDITQRKQAEEKIREKEVELRQVLDAAPQFLFVLGSDGSRIYANQSVLEFRGLTVEEWQKLKFRERFHPDDVERMAREREQALSSGSPLETEARMLRHDGKYRWFLFRYKPLKDQLGRITRWVVPAIDIDDRKRSEERLQHENVALREEIDKASMFEEIVGTSPALQTVLSRVSKVAATDSTVLITGETGTGKELVARAIHRRSPRSSYAFVSVNCAAIPRDLIASELFGHEKGAFTGATQRRLGRFELAEEARSSSTKSENFLPRPRSLCCAFCRNTNLSVSVELDPSELMFGLLRLLTATWRLPSPRARFEATCSTGSTFSNRGASSAGTKRRHSTAGRVLH